VTPAKENNFQAVMRVRVGPVNLNLSATIVVLLQDREKGEAAFHVEAADRRVGGSVRADLNMRLSQQADGHTELTIATDAVFMGKLGEFGQSVIRNKARTTMDEFARNLVRQLGNPLP
jgi:carbon monoxide dehydrogenase subunit G